MDQDNIFDLGVSSYWIELSPTKSVVYTWWKTGKCRISPPIRYCFAKRLMAKIESAFSTFSTFQLFPPTCLSKSTALVQKITNTNMQVTGYCLFDPKGGGEVNMITWSPDLGWQSQ